MEITFKEEGQAYIHANLGFAYSQLKNYGFAIMEYKKAIKIKPDNAQYHYALSMLYEAKYQVNLAQKELDLAIKLAPDNKDYEAAKEHLNNVPAASLQVGRTAQALTSIGLIIVPSYVATEKNFYPMIVYIYSESPLGKLVKEGEYIFNADSAKDDKGIIDALDLPPNTKVSLTVNNSKIVTGSIQKITRKLDNNEKMKLYRAWFNSFDRRIVEIWNISDQAEKEDVGTKWGYEFESLIRSWVSYKDPFFDSAFILLMEFFQAYTYPDKQEGVHYEINLAKLNFQIINSQITDFFKSINFSHTARYLEDKLNQLNSKEVSDPKTTLAKKPIIRKSNQK